MSPSGVTEATGGPLEPPAASLTVKSDGARASVAPLIVIEFGIQGTSSINSNCNINQLSFRLDEPLICFLCLCIHLSVYGYILYIYFCRSYLSIYTVSVYVYIHTYFCHMYLSIYLSIYIYIHTHSCHIYRYLC